MPDKHGRAFVVMPPELRVSEEGGRTLVEIWIGSFSTAVSTVSAVPLPEEETLCFRIAEKKVVVWLLTSSIGAYTAPFVNDLKYDMIQRIGRGSAAECFLAWLLIQ